jgi:hypothetical protein
MVRPQPHLVGLTHPECENDHHREPVIRWLLGWPSDRSAEGFGTASTTHLDNQNALTNPAEVSAPAELNG